MSAPEVRGYESSPVDVGHRDMRLYIDRISSWNNSTQTLGSQQKLHNVVTPKGRQYPRFDTIPFNLRRARIELFDRLRNRIATNRAYAYPIWLKLRLVVPMRISCLNTSI